jgi:alpha-mannosidase
MTGGPRKIFVVFKTHFDIGFTGLVDEVLDSYARVMFPRAIAASRQAMRDNPGIHSAWTVPAWPLAHSLETLRGTPGEAELAQAAAEGIVAWHALPFTLHTELFGLEDLIRSLFIARAMTARFGRSAVSAKMTDVPGHTWILPTLLANAGVVFLHLGCNACSTPPDVPLLFHWEGPDGSRLITMYSRGGYGTPLFPPEGWAHPFWLSLQHTQDNEGPPGADAAGRILAEVHARFPRTEVVFGSLDDFGRAIAGLAPDLPVVHKDLADSWIHGIATMPREVGTLRAVRNRLVQAESAQALRALPGNGSLKASVSAAYEKILLFGEHSWGMDTKLALNPPEFGGRTYEKTAFRAILDSGKYDRIRRSWSDKAGLVQDAQQCLREVESSAGVLDRSAAVPSLLDVVNHHVWEWNGPLRLGACDRNVRVLLAGDASEIPVARRDGDLWTTTVRVPALSSIRLKIEDVDPGIDKPRRAEPKHAAPKRAAPKRSRSGKAVVRSTGDRLTLENGRLRVTVSRSAGGVTSIVDRAGRKEWVKKGPFGTFRYDVYSRREIVSYLKSYAYDLEPWFLDDFGKPGYPDREHQSYVGALREADGKTEDGRARLRLRWQQDRVSVRELGNPAEVTLDLLLLDGQPWFDMEYTLAGKEACPLLEAGHVVMPFAARNPRFAVNKTGSVIDPDSDIARDANRLLFCCDRWVDVADGENGILVIPFDSPLFSIGEPAIERFDGSARTGDPVLNFNLFNTQWGTNFPQWMDGSFTFRFRIVPHQGNWRRARAWEHAAAAFQPPSCFRADPARKGVALLARPSRGLETVVVKGAEQGEGCILRLREPTGRGGRRSLHFSPAVLGRRPRLFRCSLLEDEQEEIQLQRSAGSLVAEFPVRPFEILTLKLRS